MENNNPKKNKTLTIIIIVLAILFLAGVIFMLAYKPAPKTTTPILDEGLVETEDGQIVEAESLPAKPVVEEPANEQELVVYKFDAEKEEAREVTAEDLKQIAFAFAERFGSYSNQANYGNIEDLKMYMSAEMRDWAERFINEQRETPYVGYYYGITTKALVGEIAEFEEEDAEIIVSTRRQEVKDEDTKVFDQNIVVSFSKIGDDWKVNSAYWQ